MNCKDCLNMKVRVPLSTASESVLFAKILYNDGKASCIKEKTSIKTFNYGKARKEEKEDGYKSWQLEDDCSDFISMDD